MAVSEGSPVQVATERKVEGIAICSICGFADGLPLMTSNVIDGVIRADRLLCLPESIGGAGDEVAVMFQDGDPCRPVVLGPVISTPASARPKAKFIRLEAEHEIEMRCGKTTIKMSDDGTVAIRGVNVATRAAHTNRIRGGNVQIN